MQTVHVQMPDMLYHKVESLAQTGWFRDEQDLLLEALRRYLDIYNDEVMEQQIRDDVEWGLSGLTQKSSPFDRLRASGR